METTESIGAIADKVTSLVTARAVDGFEIYVTSSRNLNIEVKQGKVELFRFAEPTGVSVRLLRDGSLGFSFSTSLAREDLSRMVDNAYTSAAAQTPDSCNGFVSPGMYPVLEGLADLSLAEVPEEKKIERALALERTVLDEDSRITRVHKATYAEASRVSLIRNSAGVDCRSFTTSVSSSVSALASAEGESHLGWDYDFGNSFTSVDIDRIARGAVLRATGLLGAKKIPTMRCPVVFDSYVASQMLEVLASSFIGDNVRKEKSLLCGKLGSLTLSPLLTIIDDGSAAGGGATAPFDGEGAPHERTVVVEGGVVSAFLYDACTGRKAGMPSTGNAVREGVRGIPRPGVSNFFVVPGDADAQHLLSGIARGMLITEVMGMHTANPTSGDFSVGASGFLIEDGEVTVPVKEVAITGNILEVFGAVEGVGSDFRFFGNIGTPALRVAVLDISGT